MQLPNEQAQQAKDIMAKLHAAGCVPPGPVRPESVDIDANMKSADEMYPDPWKFKNEVKNKAPWDYKQQGHQYEDFGNFNYGATGTAFGFSEQTLLREAGRAQIKAGTSQPEWGSPGPVMNPLHLGKAPYGDDPHDQGMIKAGIDFAHKSKTSCFCK